MTYKTEVVGRVGHMNKKFEYVPDVVRVRAVDPVTGLTSHGLGKTEEAASAAAVSALEEAIHRAEEAREAAEAERGRAN
jgi:hypothetical protein